MFEATLERLRKDFEMDPSPELERFLVNGIREWVSRPRRWPGLAESSKPFPFPLEISLELAKKLLWVSKPNEDDVRGMEDVLRRAELSRSLIHRGAPILVAAAEQVLYSVMVYQKMRKERSVTADEVHEVCERVFKKWFPWC